MQLLAVLGVCAAVRVWLICNAATIATDGALYILMARQWSADPAAVTRRYTYHVGYPAAIATVREGLVTLGGDEGLAGWESAGRLVSLFGALGALAALWFFALRCFDDRVAWITVLLFGLSKKWAILGSDVLTDSLTICFMMWAVVLAMWAGAAIRSLPSRRSRALAAAAAAGAGLSGAAAYLVRPEAMLVVPLAAVSCLWAGRARRRWRLAIGCVALLAAVAMAAAGPYMAAIGGLTHRHDVSKALSMALSDMSGSATPLAQIPFAVAGYSWLRHLTNRLFEAMHPAVAAMACVAVVAWVIGRLRKRKTQATCTRRPVPCGEGLYWMVGWAALFLPVLVRSYTRSGIMSYRYLLTMAILLTPLAGAGLLVLADLTREWLGRAGAGKRLAGAAATAVIMAIPTALLANTLRPMHITRLPYKRAGEALAGLARPTGGDFDPLEDLALDTNQIKKHQAAIRARGDATWSDFAFATHPLVLHYAQIKGFHLVKEQFQGQATAILDMINRCGATYMVVGEKQVQRSNTTIFTEPVFTELGAWSSGRNGRKDTVHLYRVNRKALDKTRAEITAARLRDHRARRRRATRAKGATTRTGN